MAGGGRRSTSPAWDALARGAVFAFALGAAMAVVLRSGTIRGMPLGLVADNVRHAHSHLMMMGWVVPAAMCLYVRALPSSRGQLAERVRFAGALWAWVLALLSAAPFALWGYGSVAVGAARLPPAAIASGLALLGWYAFLVGSWLLRRAPTSAERERRRAERQLWELGFALLVVASGGAWALAFGMAGGGLSQAQGQLFLRLFLELTTEGAFVIFSLAAWRGTHTRPSATYDAAARVYALGILPSFLASAGHDLGGATVLVHASVGTAALALAFASVVQLQRSSSAAQRALGGMMLVKSLVMVAAAVPAVRAWGVARGFSLAYLHFGFLGVLTPTLVLRLAAQVPGLVGVELLVVAAGLAGLSFVPLTGAWPPPLGGAWSIHAAGAAAGCAAVAAGLVTLRVRHARRARR